MVNNQDPRIFRTRKLLLTALAELLVSIGKECITIREIVRTANVNRSTFYLHFRDKEDILAQFQDEILSELKEAIKQPTFSYETAILHFEKNNEPIQAHLTMFEHIQNNSHLYAVLLKEGEFRERFTRELINEILLFRSSVWEATYMANGAVGIINYWLENGMKETVFEISLWLTKVNLVPLANFSK